MKRLTAVLLAALLSTGAAKAADDFKLEQVPSLASVPVGQLKPRTIVFAEQKGEKATDAASELDAVRGMGAQAAAAAALPFAVSRNSGSRAGVKLSMYVAEARFRLPKPAQAFDLSRYANIAFLEKLDAAIKHQPINAADAVPNKEPTATHTRPQGRNWCEDAAGCFQSRYRFEGRIPTGILLVNKLRDETKKPIPDFIEFQSEMRLRSPNEPQMSGLGALTGIDTPVAGVLEYNIFWVNQVIHSGKILAVIQPHPADRNASIATVYLALAIRSDVFTKQRDFLKAPILRNLVPAQLLMGRSSFNSGDSISAGLPQFARGRIKAIAAIIEQDK